MKKEEIKSILKAWLAVSTAFAIATAGFSSFNALVYAFLLSLFTVGIGFLFHELAHRTVARHYKCRAEFHAFNKMLILAIVFSFFGFVFAAPGAVLIAGHVEKKQYGKIALAGPLTNIFIALIFLFLVFITKSSVAKYGFEINSWLAFFNLLPFGFFDGAKVFAWSKKVFTFVFVIALALMITSALV